MIYMIQKTINEIKTQLKNSLNKAIADGLLANEAIPEFNIEIPADKNHGDLSANIAMVSAKAFKLPPRKIAEIIISNFPKDFNMIDKIEVAGPGFINFFLGNTFFSEVLSEIKASGSNYGKSDFGQNKKVMVEFVSANPTGPMHMGNARLGALGDCLSSILEAAGYQIHREFYINDAGNQIDKFALSLDVRYQQICKGEGYIQIPEECYQGQDITDLAQEFFNLHADKYMEESETERQKTLVDFALPKNIQRMKDDMAKYKIFFDNWFHESTLYESGDVEKALQMLKNTGLTYEQDGALWYKLTESGEEKDIVLVRQNGTPTYITPDIAYHYNKFVTRGFDICIDILGADHHGHAARINNIMEALGFGKDKLHILLVQLVKLTRGGEVVRMSKRTGKAIQLADLLDEVSPDAARFIFNTKEANSGMDFDLDLAVKEDAQNPVYYVQYAHARICSIFKSLNNFTFENQKINLELLTKIEEKSLIFHLANYVSEIEQSAKTFEPTKITRYVVELATLFHRFYAACKVRCEDENLMTARLFLCDCTRIVIKNVLDMFKVNAPEIME